MEIQKLMDEIVEKAQFGINKLGWNKDETIRYIYISLGKEISKSTKFFYSVEEKFDENDRLSIEEMKKIHEADFSFEVTCRGSAKMIVEMLQRVGIEAKLMMTVASDKYLEDAESSEMYDIYHYFVLCVGEEGKKYFLTLNADLVNIKFGFSTEHFANNISYYVIDPKTGDYCLDQNGEKIQYYQGEKVDNSIMPIDKIKEIDKKIGYLTNFGEGRYDYVPDLSYLHKKEMDTKYSDILILEDNYNFYRGLEELFLKFGKEKIRDLTRDELIEIEKYICNKSISLIETRLGSEMTDEVRVKINDLLLQKDFKSISIEINKFISNISKEKEIDTNESELYQKSFAIGSAMINVLRAIEKLINSESEMEIREDSSRYRNCFKTLLKLFADQSYLKDNKGSADRQTFSNKFLYKRLKNLFMYDFECMETTETGYLPDFCSYGVLQQQNFIKEYLRKIFQGIFADDSEYEKRVLFSSIVLDENLENYCFLIGIYNDRKPEEHTYFFIYDPLSNTMTDDISALDIMINYKLLSQTVNAKIEKIENSGRKV